ncbi:MAG: S8 family serine peptidase, partial [Anaerolineales bacterium]|nr:S8 family serine peptidase [Anaerolineales bacterium]
DGNGYVDDVHGWNMVNDNASLSDNTGHGTEVAGVIAAAANNGQGIAGLCWNCRLMILKVTQPGGIANYSDIIEAIQYATLKGADVVNLSLGGSNNSVSLRLAVEAAAETAVVVGGAGNDNDDAPFYPAAYDSVLAVAGTNAGDARVSSSNYGVWVDVAAPGELITTTFDGGSYGMTSGTSMAAPFVSGLAGLLRSAHPAWSADMGRAQILQTAAPIDGLNPGYAGLLGSGRIDAAAALTTPAQPALRHAGQAVDGVENGRPEPNSTFDLEITLTNAWAAAANVQATLSSADPYVTLVNGSAGYGSIDTFAVAGNQTPFRVAVSGAAPYGHELALLLQATADGGYTTAIPITVTIASGIQHVSGLITSDTTWSRDKQYVVTGNILVQSGVTLTVEAGTSIQVHPGMIIRVDGVLLAQGTASHPISFTSSQAAPAAGDWVGIDGGHSGGVIRLAYCEVAYAQTAVVSSLNLTQNSISHCHIHHNLVGIQADNDVIAHSRILQNSQSGIVLAGPSDLALITKNEIAYNAEHGIHSMNDGIVMGNLIHHNGAGFAGDIGIMGGQIVSNTILWNAYGIVFSGQLSAPIHHNNLWGSSAYDVYHTNAQNVALAHNWWGTTDAGQIDQQIYDFQDDFNLGIVTYTPVLTEPAATAPAFLENLTISPASPIGIETATFEVRFSRAIDQSAAPSLTFYDSRRGTSTQFSEADGLGDNFVGRIVADGAGRLWFSNYESTSKGVSVYDGRDWQVYTAANSGLAANAVNVVFAEENGRMLFAHNTLNTVSTFDGASWDRLQPAAGGFPSLVVDIAQTPDGDLWFATLQDGLYQFDGQQWLQHTTASGLPSDNLAFLAADTGGSLWFTWLTSSDSAGLTRFNGTQWDSWSTINNLPLHRVHAMFADSAGRVWLSSEEIDPINGAVPALHQFDAGSWLSFDAADPIWNGCPANIDPYRVDEDALGRVWLPTGCEWLLIDAQNAVTRRAFPAVPVALGDIAFDKENHRWHAYSWGLGAIAFWHGHDYALDSAGLWLDPQTYRATYEMTSLVPRGAYTLTVTGAQGVDGLAVPSDSRFTFAVDYAGEITNQPPPAPPFVLAGGVAGNAASLEAHWFAQGGASSIIGYRYALGSAPGATDIINWTTTTETTLYLTGLGLVDGQMYWLAVQARNAGGLWSTSAYSSLTAGQPLSRVFLPAVTRP